MFKTMFSLKESMNKTLPIYLISGIIGLISLYAGLTGQKILFVNNPRTALITLAIVGFMMCSTGALAPFITNAPAHPLSLLGYTLGIIAMIIALNQIFNWGIPYISDPKNGLIVLSVLIVVKIVIARFGFIFK